MAILIRILARIALLGVAGALRRGTVPPAYRTPGQQPATHFPADRLRILRSVREWTGIAARLISIVVLLGATGTLFAAGLTLTSLGPRWVGIPLLVLCAITLVLALVEARVLRHIVVLRRRDARLLKARPQER